MSKLNKRNYRAYIAWRKALRAELVERENHSLLTDSDLSRELGWTRIPAAYDGSGDWAHIGDE